VQVSRSFLFPCPESSWLLHYIGTYW
jgi:hypothetical protein